MRLVTRRRPAKHSQQVRNLVRLLGSVIALVLALSIPLGYGIIGYFKEGRTLTYKAELTAARAAQYIYAPEAPWRYDTDQLAAISEIRTSATAPIVQRILDMSGSAMMQKGDPLPSPTFARHAPIFAAGTPVGLAEVSASLRPLLAEVTSVGLGSIVLAIAVYFAFAYLPLGALDRMLAELKQREEELGDQNARFNGAINAMSQGLCLFDEAQRVVFANQRFAEIYGLAPEQVKRGTTLREILVARAGKGAYGDIDTNEFVAEGTGSFRQEVSQILPLADGRFISVLRRPAPDGSLVSTHEDVTERETLSARLREQNGLLRKHEEELQTQNVRFDAALMNMSHGLCMFDAEQRVLIANARYAEIYGLDAGAGEARHDLAPDHRAAHRQGALRGAQSRGLHQGAVGDVRRALRCRASAERWALHLRAAAADARRRLGHHARGRHRAREAQSQSNSSSRTSSSTRP